MTHRRLVVPIAPQLQGSGSWLRVLLLGLLFFALGIAVLVLTHNSRLFPAVVLLGSFTVPVAYVAFLYDRRRMSLLTAPVVAMAFFYGGVLGVFAAGTLEPLFIRRMNPLAGFQVGLIEEFAKILGVLVITLHRRHTSEMNGLILGAAAGMGFAALESMGYSFDAFMQSHGDLTGAIVLTLVRGILAPIGHGTWTAILAGVMFRESVPGNFRFDSRVLLAYVIVSGLHGLWDAIPGTLLSSSKYPLPAFFVSLTLVASFGVVLLWGLWHQARLRQIIYDSRAGDDMAPE